MSQIKHSLNKFLTKSTDIVAIGTNKRINSRKRFHVTFAVVLITLGIIRVVLAIILPFIK